MLPAAIADRSLTAQIEHWARMGKKMDEQITGAAMMAFKSAAPGQEVEDQAQRSEIEAVLAKLRQPGYAEMVARGSHDLDVHEVLYGADPDGSDWIVAHYRDGRKVKGEDGETSFRSSAHRIGRCLSCGRSQCWETHSFRAYAALGKLTAIKSDQ